MSCVTWCDYEGQIPTKNDPDSALCVWEISLSTFSNWFRNQILGILSGEEIIIPSAMYIAVHSTVSSAATPGTELSGDGYGRSLITFERVSDIQRWNPTDVTSPVASAEWPTIASMSLWDSPTIGGGNYYAYGNLPSTTSINASKAIKWSANKIIVGMGSPL